MAPARVLSSAACTIADNNNTINIKNNQPTAKEALEAAKARFVERNATSLTLHNEAVKSLPGGNTRSLLHTAPFPVFLKKGSGYQVTSEDGHTYTDFVGEMTAALFGHSQPLITRAIIDTIQDVGMNLGGTTSSEARHAALLCTRFSLPLIRFTNSGTEANLHALAAAKRHTGRRRVVVFTGGYHGGCFAFPSDTPAANVVDRDDWIVAEYNDVDDTRRKIEESGDVAAVLVEGMQGAGPLGAIFILDEVMTSRLSSGGLQKLENLQPDITTMGKYLGGGISFGAFGGRADVMGVYDPRDGNALAHSGTFNNNTLGMVAGYVGMSQVYTPDVAREFNAMGDRLQAKLQEISHGTKMTVTGRGTIIGIHFLEDGKKELKSYRERKDEVELKDLFWFEMMEDGFWISKRGSIALILGTPWEELDRFVGCVQEFLRRHEALVKI
ncbi:hypothetical protein SLS60_011902 [Paraconiothyrium brasiliense]|uniref:Glutamate-1-semialdehyde 2,1-aminomutase n=1 Tax=Paraconiothyrium brasiliense TaxID=300254 RepID=A0ABR3QH73_9PLEO